MNIGLKLSPKSKRNINRIIPFGVIWFLVNWTFFLVELAAVGSNSTSPEATIEINFPIFIFSSFALISVGLLVGIMETIFFENLFSSKSFVTKISYKLLLYTLIMLVIVSITYPIAASMEMEMSLFDIQVRDKFFDFLMSVAFLSTLLQMASSVLLCLIYAGISDNLGYAVMANFLTGKYHTARSEKRIFMFLDMKSSTTIAEQLGHIRYFELLKEYYADLTDGIINHSGEVYQYIGDEVVISWLPKAGLQNNNCLKCFFAMKENLLKRKDYYKHAYGVSPSFKAGLHLGDVTTGEIGALKKEIFFTGDVLNVTARIQGLCNQYKKDLLVSDDLIAQLNLENTYDVTPLGQSDLRGRSEPMELYAIEEE